MTIKKIEIKGYRSLRHVVWEPGALNLVIGPNGSGKSNLLQALDLLAKSARRELAKSIIERGGLWSILWDQTEPQLVWNVSGNEAVFGEFNYMLALAPGGLPGGGIGGILSANYHIAAEKLFGNSAANSTHQLILFESERGQARRYNGPTKKFEAVDDFNPNDAETLGSQHIPLLSLARAPLWDIRVNHSLNVDPGAPSRAAAVTQFAPQLFADGSNLIPFLHTNYSNERKFRDGLDDAMRAAFPDFDRLDFPPAEDRKIQLRIAWKSLKHSHSASLLSDGTIRFIWLCSLLLHWSGGIIAVDEPETGLHPHMFSILAELARDAAEYKQVIFTTHSSEFLDAFSKFAPTITVTACEKGETHLSVVDKDELRRWLKEYSPGALFRSGELEALA